MEPVYYTDYTSFPQTQEKLGHWVGIAPNVGDILCYEILTDKHTIINRSTVRSALPQDQQNRRLGHVFPRDPQQLHFEVFPPQADQMDAGPDMQVGDVDNSLTNSGIVNNVSQPFRGDPQLHGNCDHSLSKTRDLPGTEASHPD